MKITYERYDFTHGSVEKLERDIEATKVLAANALFQQLSRKLQSEKDAKKRAAKQPPPSPDLKVQPQPTVSSETA